MEGSQRSVAVGTWVSGERQRERLSRVERHVLGGWLMEVAGIWKVCESISFNFFAPLTKSPGKVAGLKMPSWSGFVAARVLSRQKREISKFA